MTFFLRLLEINTPYSDPNDIVSSLFSTPRTAPHHEVPCSAEASWATSRKDVSNDQVRGESSKQVTRETLWEEDDDDDDWDWDSHELTLASDDSSTTSVALFD